MKRVTRSSAAAAASASSSDSTDSKKSDPSHEPPTKRARKPKASPKKKTVPQPSEKPPNSPPESTTVSDTTSSSNNQAKPSSSSTPIRSKLSELLEPIHTPTSGESVEEVLARHKKCFTTLSNYLLNIPSTSPSSKILKLYINGVPHSLEELEFYFTSPEHPDPFTHCDPIQQNHSVFYFHKMGSGYKGGSFKGMDIAIGLNSERMGGLLVRSIRRLDTDEFICGPSLTVDHMIKLCGASTVQDLVERCFKNDISVDQNSQNGKKLMYLCEEEEENTNTENKSSDDETKTNTKKKGKTVTKTTGPRQCFFSPRVGLYLTKKEVEPRTQKLYLYQMYRALCSPDLINKGRSLMIVSKLVEKISKDEKFVNLSSNEQIDLISREMGLPLTGVKNCVTSFFDTKKEEESKKSSVKEPRSSKWMGKSNLSQDDITKCFAVHYVEGFVHF